MRHIASEMFTDEYFGTLPMEHRVLWIGLIAAVADDQGRFMDNAALIRAMIFPYDEKVTIKTIEKGLELFAEHHKITRYTAGLNGSGKRLIQIVNWWKYQRSTQWAAESTFPSPPKWHDRVRIHKPGNGNVPYTLNWSNEGGYIQPTKAVRTTSKGDRPKPKPKQRPTQTPKQKQPPTKPSSSKRKPKTAPASGGGGNGSASLDWLNQIDPAGHDTAKVIAPILRSSGLGQTKIVTLLAKVATRIKPSDAIRYTLAALASVYGDNDIRNKPVVAAHRIEQDSVPPIFMNSHTWNCLPAEVLASADVDPARLPKPVSKNAKVNDIQRVLGATNG